MSKRNLATIDSDMFTPIGRLIQQAFAHGITNDMIYGGLEVGQTALQATTAITATQNCSIGTRRVTWDGMVYRYGSAESTLKTPFLCGTSNKYQEIGYSLVTTGADAGGNTIIFTVSGSDGDGSGNIAVDYLKGGIICIDMGQAGSLYQMRIKSNTVLTGGGGGAMTLVVDGAFPLEVTTSMYIEAMASPYKALSNTSLNARTSYLGLPQRAATAVIPYSWILTHGPCWITPNNTLGTHNVGTADYSVALIAHSSVNGGSVGPHTDAYALSKWAQHIGFILSWSQSNTQGAPFVMLDISS